MVNISNFVECKKSIGITLLELNQICLSLNQKQIANRKNNRTGSLMRLCDLCENEESGVNFEPESIVSNISILEFLSAHNLEQI